MSKPSHLKPISLALPDRTVPALLEQSRQFGEERPFLIDIATGTTLSYGVLLAHVSAAAHALSERIAPGSRVGVMLSNRLEYVIVRFALSVAGLVEVALNGNHKGTILESMLEIGEPQAMLIEDRFRPQLSSCRYQIPSDMTIGDSELVSITRRQSSWSGRPGTALGPGSPARILFTSGTTSGTKGAELSHGYEVFSGECYARTLDVGPDDRWLHVTPFFHIDAVAEVAAILHSGGAFVLAPRFSASRFWQDAQTYGATAFFYGGTVLSILLRGAGPNGDTPIRIAYGGNASGAVCQAFEAQFGIPAIEIFGMTECIAATVNTGRRHGSVGTAFEGYEVAVVDEHDGVLMPGRRGEIVIRSLQPWGLMTRYSNDPVATATSFRNFWFHTGDLGSFDDDGYMYCHGRMRDVIRRRGENIAAAELESAAEEHPGVVRAAAVGVAAELGEEEVMLYAQVDAAREVTPESIVAFLETRVASFMVPLYLKLVDELPLSTTNKVSKSGLKREPDAHTWING